MQTPHSHHCLCFPPTPSKKLFPHLMVTKWEKLHFGRRKGRQSPASAKKRKKKNKPSQHYAGAMVSWGKKHPYKKVQTYNITLSLFCSSISLDAISGLEFFLSLSYLPLSLYCSPLHGLSFLLLSSAAEGAALKGQGMLCTYIRARGCFENPQGKGEGPKQGALAEPP